MEKSRFPYGWSVHILLVQGAGRRTFAGPHGALHQPYVALKADAKPASYGERGTLLTHKLQTASSESFSLTSSVSCCQMHLP